MDAYAAKSPSWFVRCQFTRLRQPFLRLSFAAAQPN